MHIFQFPYYRSSCNGLTLNARLPTHGIGGSDGKRVWCSAQRVVAGAPIEAYI